MSLQTRNSEEFLAEFFWHNFFAKDGTWVRVAYQPHEIIGTKKTYIYEKWVNMKTYDTKEFITEWEGNSWKVVSSR